MENKKHTKKALFGSVIALILCCAMLIGTTFAWFTDSESTAINTIQSGSLDVELQYALQSDVANGEISETAWKDVSANQSVFKEGALYEPGYTEVVYFRVMNKGSLALKYQMSADIVKEASGINVNGEIFNLSNYLCAYHDTGDSLTVYTGRTLAQTVNGWARMVPDLAPATLAEAVDMEVDAAKGLTWEVALEPGETEYSTLVLFMPTTVGNEANHSIHEGTVPTIELGINLVATQNTVEEDSFGTDYDENAEYPELPNPDVEEPAEDINIDDMLVTDSDGFASLSNMTINGTATANESHSTIMISNVTGTGKFVINAENTVAMQDCSFELADGEKLVTFNNSTTSQFLYHNVTVNGEKITSANVHNYVDGAGSTSSF